MKLVLTVLCVLVVSAFGTNFGRGIVVKVKLSNGISETLNVLEVYQQHFLLEFSKPTKATLIVVLFAVWLVSMVAKTAIFRSILMNGFRARPVNLLMFLDQAVGTIRQSCLIWSTAIFMATGQSFSYHLGSGF